MLVDQDKNISPFLTPLKLLEVGQGSGPTISSAAALGLSLNGKIRAYLPFAFRKGYFGESLHIHSLIAYV